MDIVLIAGLWLSSDVWDDVARALGELGHRALPVRLPGQGDGDTGASHGRRSVWPPAVISNSARRFCANAASSVPCATGRSSP